MDLLQEALRRAKEDVTARMAAEDRDETDAFVDKMLSLSGNTAPYMLYAYARIRGIQRRAAEKLGEAALDLSGLRADELLLTEPAEASLARHILRFPDVVREVEADLLPSKLCEY